MITRLISWRGAQTGPFARILAEESRAVIAANPGERISSDISGRTRLCLLPSGVFFPAVDNILPAQTRFRLDDWMKDTRTLSARGYGPVKLHLDPRCVPESDREAVLPFLETVDPDLWKEAGDLLIEGNDCTDLGAGRTICVMKAPDLSEDGLASFLRERRATHLALTEVRYPLPDLPLPLWGWTQAGAPMKVIWPSGTH